MTLIKINGTWGADQNVPLHILSAANVAAGTEICADGGLMSSPDRRRFAAATGDKAQRSNARDEDVAPSAAVTL